MPARLALAVGSFRAPRDTAGILETLGRYYRGASLARLQAGAG